MSRTSRRTVVQGAVWTVPVMAAGVAAPAYAASQGCVAGESEIATQSGPVTQFGFPPSSLTATVAYSTATYPGGVLPPGTGRGAQNIHASPPYGAIVLTQTTTASAGASATMKVTLSQPVENLSLVVDSIGRGGSFEHEWADVVVVDSPGYTISQRGTSIIGSGSAADPLRSNDGSSTSDSATLLWAGPVSEVQLTYVAGADEPHPFGMDIGIGKFAFTC